MRADPLALVVSVAVVGLASYGCGGSPAAPDPPPAAASVDCGPSLSVEWHVELPGEEIPTGESRVATLLPGIAFPLACAERVAVVDWSLEGPAVARVTVVPGADSSVTSRAWLTGLTPGSALVHARVVLRDGSAHEARPATVRVGASQAGQVGRLVVDEVIEIRGIATTISSTPQMPLVLPVSGRVEVVVDWDSVQTTGVRFTLLEGFWDQSKPGKVVIDSGPWALAGAKPQRASAEYLAAGNYSFQILADMKPGTIDRMRYQVRVSPR